MPAVDILNLIRTEAEAMQPLATSLGLRIDFTYSSTPCHGDYGAISLRYT